MRFLVRAIIPVLLATPVAINAQAQTADPHGWMESGVGKGQYGTLEFTGGYPSLDSVKRLDEAMLLNRAVEVYLAQMPAVSWYRVWKGVSEAGTGAPNQLVIWETLMDAQTLLLTGNTETVYGIGGLDLKRDGPIVIEAPAMLLGGVSDIWQQEIVGIGPTGTDKGKGGRFLILPPDYKGQSPEGYMTAKSRTYRAVLGVRGFLVEGKTDKAVALMKSIKVYPLSRAGNPPKMTFFNGSGQQIDTIFSDSYQYFEDLANIIALEPAGIVASHERFKLAQIGIEHGRSFVPDAARKTLLGEAARLGGEVARANTFASSDPARLIYPDRRWEWLFVGGSATWDSQGYLNTDRRAGFAYAAIGMSPAMVEKVVGAGSQYYFTPRDSTGAFLMGENSYRLHLPPKIPAKAFWSVVVYDAQSRSMLRNGQPFPTVSQFTRPASNADGSIDIYFGPTAPQGQEKNWIKTVPGKGWFPLIRFYSPLEPLFDGSWKPGDVVAVK